MRAEGPSIRLRRRLHPIRRVRLVVRWISQTEHDYGFGGHGVMDQAEVDAARESLGWRWPVQQAVWNLIRDGEITTWSDAVAITEEVAAVLRGNGYDVVARPPDRGPCLCPTTAGHDGPWDPEWAGDQPVNPACPYHGAVS